MNDLRQFLWILFVFLGTHSAVSQSVVVNEIMSSNSHTVSDIDGDFPDWIELYNRLDIEADLSGWGLSDDMEDPFKWVFPQFLLPEGSHLLVFASGKNRHDLDEPDSRFHTNFKISSSGESLLLSRPDHHIVDSLFVHSMPADISYGRQPDGGDAWFYFEDATPGTSNTQTAYDGIAPVPEFSEETGFYDSPFELSLVNNEGFETRFTTDATVPSISSTLWLSDLEIEENSVVRAENYAPNYVPSGSVSQTYVFNDPSELPVFFLTSDPGNFFDPDTGIYVEGNCLESWERDIHITFQDAFGSDVISQNAGVRIFGGYSRNFLQKSLAFFARGQYGPSSFSAQLFPDRDIHAFESFVLRTSGSDVYSDARDNGTMLRDGMMTGLVYPTGVAQQAFRPVTMYLNGQYWGLHNLREKINEHYLASHYGVDPDEVNLLQWVGAIIEGDNSEYLELVDFLENSDLSDQASFDFVEARMDVDDFASYNVSQIFFGNVDWPGNNVKYWSSNSKWRWILFDTDYGFSLKHDFADVTHNTLEYALDPEGEAGWPCPNPPWSTLFIRCLMENEGFKHRFINRYCVLRSILFHPDFVRARIDSLSANIENEMPRQIERWGGSLPEWEENVEELKDFASHRLSYLDEHYRTQFDLMGGSSLSLDIADDVGGHITIDSYPISSFPWSTFFFEFVPIELQAIPDPGWEFVEWDDGLSADQRTLILTENVELQARFIEVGPSSEIVISEINYNSADAFDPGDWIEITNNTNDQMDVSNWRFKDSDDEHLFIFPSSTAIQAHESLVLCSDLEAFQSLFPEVTSFIGEFSFGLSGGGELIRLYNHEGTLVDSLVYDDDAPWPTEPDGDGPTLELTNLDLDNALPGSWIASEGHGSPGSFDEVGLEPFVPRGFQLFQNAPNPFNPITTIAYYLPHDGQAELIIYNLLGKVVRILVQEYKTAGGYEVLFQGNDFSSGMYFYSLHLNGEHLGTKKMILAK